MNIVKRAFKLICIFIFCIPIVACGRISRFEWNEVEYNKIAEMIDQKETFYALFKRDDCPYCPEFVDTVKNVAKEKKLAIYVVETSKMSEDEREEYNKKFTEKYVPVIYSVSSGKVDNNVLGNITKSKMEKFIKHE